MYEKRLSRGISAYIYKIYKLNLKAWWWGQPEKYGFFKKMLHLLFKPLLDMSHRSRDILRKGKFCVFFRVISLLKIASWHQQKIGLRYG